MSRTCSENMSMKIYDIVIFIVSGLLDEDGCNHGCFKTFTDRAVCCEFEGVFWVVEVRWLPIGSLAEGPLSYCPSRYWLAVGHFLVSSLNCLLAVSATGFIF